MGKTFTRFLIGVFAVMLLALPAQAGSQDPLARKAPGFHPAKNMVTQKYLKGGTPGEMLLRQVTENKDVRLTSLQKAMIQKEKDAAWFKGQAPWSKKRQMLNKHFTASTMTSSLDFASQTALRPFTLENMATPRFKGAKKVIESEEVVDDNGIIITPDKGEHVMYYRTGDNIYVQETTAYLGKQDGQVEVVVTRDGVYYFKDFVSTYPSGAWVKGTRSGDVITMKAGQPVFYSENYKVTTSINLGKYVQGSGFSKEEGNITLTIDDEKGTITLNDTGDLTAGGKLVGVFWDDDNWFTGYADYNTIYTLEAPEVPEVVELPEGVESETWYMNGQLVNSSYSLEDYSREVQVAIVGDDVYVQGISTYLPEAWVKGTIDGTTATFPVQFMGNVFGRYDLYLIGTEEVGEDYQIAPVVMTYDPLARTLTAVGDILVNIGNEEIGYAEWYYTTVISAEPPVEPGIVTGDPVDAPYYNTLDSEEEVAQMGVYDANGDDVTWTFVGGYARYLWSETDDADDWLLTPAVKLEAGKKYNFSADFWAESADYPERAEVVMVSEATTAALARGITVIEPFVVDNEDAETKTSADIVVEETGYYHFAIHAISDANQYVLNVDNIVIEAAADPNAPAAVADLTVTASSEKLAAIIAFTAPATTVGGEALTANMSKVELYRDGKLIKTFTDVAPAAKLEFVDEAEDLTVGNHKYYVVAYNDFGIGKKSDTVQVFLISILEVPYTADFSSNEVFESFVVIDANSDGSTWEWSSVNNAYYRFSEDNDGDDYLISMPVKLVAGQNYLFSVYAKANSVNYPERFELLIGKEPTPEALTIKAIGPTDVTSTQIEEFQGLLSVTESGNYYVALHGISDADGYFLLVDSIVVDFGPEGTAPDVATNIEVVPAALGKMEATVSFTMPAKAIDGSALSGALSADILRDGTLVTTLTDLAAGAQASWIDTFEGTPGFYGYQVAVSNASGKGLKSEKVSAFIGTDQPLAPTNTEVTEQGQTILASWTKVGNMGRNYGYVDPTKVEYGVYEATLQSFFGMYYFQLADEPYGTVVGQDKLTINVDPNEGEQQYSYFAVTASNEFTAPGDVKSNYDLAALLTGKPYELPVIEGFEGASLHYFWDSNASMYISHSSSDGDGVALKLCAEEAGPVYIMTGKLDVASAANPTLFFDVKSGAMSQMTVGGMIDGTPVEFSTTVNLTNDYQTVKMPLSALKQGRHAQLAFIGQINTPATFNEAGNLVAFGDPWSSTTSSS